ncbi:uncharacterized protein LOC127776703 [Oryza glaberrima]|uniref:PGG domain-containing protein n=1 Tax=Oryza glaberrima TaxID=4538 RepID=I1Q1Q3_ORYGL|nr:uncharacterized protein LOC127776703 [Oryza glaberrima]
MASPDTGTTPPATADQQPPKPPSWEYQLREYLLLLSSVVAIATYSAGLAPPGGVRQKDAGGGQYKAGDPTLQDIAAAGGGGAAHARYLAFYYCNATAFAASLVVNLLLLVLEEASTVGLAMLRTVMVLDVLALMAAYAAGSCRDLPSTVYVSTLVVALSAYLAIRIIYQTGRNPLSTTTTSPAGAGDDDVDNQLRKVLMLLATFATEITYTAGLGPPGGFQDDGGPTLRTAGGGQSARLAAFFYCNTAAFVASLSIVVPLLSSRLQRMHLELYPPILAALLGLMGAYTAGSSRDLRTIAYVVALVAAVLAYILLAMAIALKKKKKKHDVDLPGGIEDSETARPPRNEKDGQLEGEKGSKNNEPMKDNDFVLLLATLAASITYQAGLDPPGGVWSEDDKLYGRNAGDPILLSTHAKRYKAFFYCNSTAFAASLVVILMVQSKIVKGKALVIATMILDLFGLIGAYAAGSCRDVSTSIYVIALAGAVLVYVVIHVVFWPDNCYVSNQKDKEVEKRRERLLLLAILVATIAYQAGLTPPGGFWNKDDGESGHRAGVPVLLDNYPRRYHAFFYCNATAFMASVALIILLVNPKLYKLGIRCYTLYVCMMVGMFGLMGAYAAGSARKVRTSIYVFVLVGVVIAFLLVQLVYFNIQAVWKQLLVFLNVKKEPTSNSDSANTTNGSSSDSEQNIASNTEEESKKKEYLMTLAILAASVTYQAGLNPPGSVWQEGGNVGNPVMRDNNYPRYNAFFYCNSTSFMASIIVIILLLQQYQKKYGGFLLYAMNMVIVVDLLGLLGAYAAGSCRDWETSGYVIALAVVVLACIMIHFMLLYHNGRSKGRVGGVQEINTLPVNHS